MKRNKILIDKRREYIKRRVRELYNSGICIAAAVAQISLRELFISERQIYRELNDMENESADNKEK